MKQKRYFITNPVIFVSQPEIKGEEKISSSCFSTESFEKR